MLIKNETRSTELNSFDQKIVLFLRILESKIDADRICRQISNCDELCKICRSSHVELRSACLLLENHHYQIDKPGVLVLVIVSALPIEK